MPDRRAFLEQLGTSAMFAALPLSLGSLAEFVPAAASVNAEKWDLGWVSRVTGKQSPLHPTNAAFEFFLLTAYR